MIHATILGEFFPFYYALNTLRKRLFLHSKRANDARQEGRQANKIL